MKIKSLEINNILSIEKARIEFDDVGLVLIEGFNYDDDTHNGAGKTAIMNALSFGLYEKFPRKVTVSNILRRGAKSASVVVDGIETNNGVWRVERHRPKAAIYSKDGEVQDISQAEFEKAIGLSYNQFLIAMYSAQINGENFIDMNDSSKKDFILQLMNLNDFASAKNIADKEIKLLEHKLQELAIREASLTSKCEVYSQSIVDIKATKEQIAAVKKQIKTSLDKIKELENIGKPDTSEYNSIIKDLNDRREVIREIKYERSSLVAEFSSLAKEYKHWTSDDSTGEELKCPSCDDPIWLIDGNLVCLTDIDKMNKVKQTKAEQIKQQCKELKSKIDDKDVEIAKGNDIDAAEDKIHADIEKSMGEYNSARQSISEYKSYVSNQEYKLSTLEERVEAQEKQQKAIDQIEKELVILKNTTKSHTDELELLRTVSHLYSPTGAPAYIMDSVVDAFNDCIEKYINMIWPNISYSIQVYKENKTGDVKAKFSDRLVLDGKDISIGSLSGGQHRCLSLAVDFAMLDVLSERFNIQINPVIFDEPLQGLDASNKERVLEVLEIIAADRSIIIIEHSSEFKSAFSKTINVELKNGVSTVSA